MTVAAGWFCYRVTLQRRRSNCDPGSLIKRWPEQVRKTAWRTKTRWGRRATAHGKHRTQRNAIALLSQELPDVGPLVEGPGDV